MSESAPRPERSDSPDPDGLATADSPKAAAPSKNTRSEDTGGAQASSRPRKLAVFGLPWYTTEETVAEYFSQFGKVEMAEVMKDRYTGKSRGFGFVIFAEADAAQDALQSEHTIDGRRCEIKVAVPKGDPPVNKTTRIFVARINPSVTDSEFRQYFEKFGKLTDAYMPKDHAKQGHRGIGFITYETPDAVDRVIGETHVLGGSEVAVDRAAPKDDGPMGFSRGGPPSGHGYHPQQGSYNQGRGFQGSHGPHSLPSRGYRGGFGGYRAPDAMAMRQYCQGNGGWSYGYDQGPSASYSQGNHGNQGNYRTTSTYEDMGGQGGGGNQGDFEGYGRGALGQGSYEEAAYGGGSGYGQTSNPDYGYGYGYGGYSQGWGTYDQTPQAKKQRSDASYADC